MADEQAGPSGSSEAEEVVNLLQANGSNAQADGDNQRLRAVTPNAEKTRELLNQLALGQQPQRQKGRRAGDPYAFWGTQPVAQFNEDPASLPATDCQIDRTKTAAEVRQDPYGLPADFEWSICNMSDDKTVHEVFELLTYHYVEDDDEMFRFKYSREFLQWALQPPGFRQDWHIGVRACKTKRLVGFITGVPATLRVRTNTISMAEINFLCVHKKLRSKRLAPVLIKEITRRVNLQNIWQAAYTAGVVLPKPVAECQYYHRSLNPKKLVSVGFSRLPSTMTMARLIKLYKLPEEPLTPGIRPLTKKDIPQVTHLLSNYLSKFQLAPVLNEEEVEHFLMPVEGVIDSYIVESAGSIITDLVSYYTLPSTIIGNPSYQELKAAFMYYTVATQTPLQQLMRDVLILSKAKGHDVFNALDIFENDSFLKDLKFGIGDGRLRYYLYNWRVVPSAETRAKNEPPLTPKNVGLVLL